MATNETEGDSHGFKSTRLRGKDVQKAHEIYVAIRQILAPDFGKKILQVVEKNHGKNT
jgi:hypothetical protein